MITSRPQTSNVLSFVLFLVIAGILITINLLSIFKDPYPPILDYAIVVVLIPVSFFILYKVFFRYKIITMGNSQITVRYPQFRSERKYSLKEIESWGETVIKTGKTSTYKELEILFTDKKRISMAFREYTEYDRLVAYLNQKVAGLKKEATA